MRGARSSGWALACALAACAAPAVQEPKAAEAPAAAAPAAPLSPERQRLERWKEGGSAVDPREGFARAAEEEAERRRRAAIAHGPETARDGLEAEMVADRLGELGAGGGGCFEEEPDLAMQDDWITHRTLTREDFLSREKLDVEPVVSIPGGEVAAYVMIRFACIVKGRASEPEPGHAVVEIERVKYLALLSRQGSWWNPDGIGNDEWILRHEQLHFDVAELFAQELTRRSPGLHAALRGTGPDPNAAIDDFERRWRVHMHEQRARFDAFEEQYDRETWHGTDFQRQTEWFARVKRGLSAVRAGLDVPPTLHDESR